MIVTLPYGNECAPGGTIQLNIDYLNNCNVILRKTRVNLWRDITYTATGVMKPLQHESAILQTWLTNETHFKIVLPNSLLRTNEKHCKNVRIKYSLEVEGISSSFHQRLKVTIPISVGEKYFQPKVEFNFKIGILLFLIILLIFLISLIFISEI